jgi:RimJ/RimL family protein N-acetyltransferase
VKPDADAQGQGCGCETASLLVEYAFGERDLRKLEANARADGEPSRAVLEGLGSREEGDSGRTSSRPASRSTG